MKGLRERLRAAWEYLLHAAALLIVGAAALTVVQVVIRAALDLAAALWRW